jgi:hypothetical protein
MRGCAELRQSKYAAAQGYGAQVCDATKPSYLFFSQAHKKIKPAFYHSFTKEKNLSTCMA